MIIPKHKIQVFISSACGDEPEKLKYNIVRKALKELIESTGFAEAYVFEAEGASTASAGQHYTFALEDSDVCIFLIDNSDGVPSGVQKEIDTAKKHGIKSLFYFCDQTLKAETPLQKSLKGAKYAKSETIHDFKELIKCGAFDLINDLVTIYKHYCKGRLEWHEDPSTEQSKDISNAEVSIYSEGIMQKDVFTNIDVCKEYFEKLILDYPYDEVKKTGTIDQLCAAFLPMLFEEGNINKDSLCSLLLEIKKHQTTPHFIVTSKRYDAIIDYFLGNQEACIKNLDEALRIAKENCLPEWLIKDILIDLRNQNVLFEEGQNTYLIENQYQKELDSSQSLLYYPLLDRLNSNYYEGIIQEAIKRKIQSPSTIIFGNSLTEQIKLLAGIYVLAMYNGSLTQILLIYERIKYITFYCSTQYSNWSIKKLLLKTTIRFGRYKEIDGIIQCFGDLLCKMNGDDAYEIYSFANCMPIAHQQFISKLEAFRITSYYMDDDKFDLVWAQIYELINKWVKDDNSTVIVGAHIFPALEGSYLRIPQDQLIEIICTCFSTNKRRYYNETFEFISKCVNLNQASSKNADTLLKAIINIMRNPDERENIHKLEGALITLRKSNRELTEELDKIIADELPDFYNGTYRLETTVKEKEDMPDFLKLYVSKIRADNELQEKNGMFLRYGDRPHIIIKNIIKHTTIKFSDDLIDSIFEVSIETLLKENQIIEAKIDAIDLLVYLLKSQPNLHERNKLKIKELLSNKSQVTTAKAVMTNLSETNIKFTALFLYNCVGEDIAVDLLGTLADIGDDTLSNRIASAAILNYLEADYLPMSDILLEHIILQKTIEWCAESDLEIRYNAVQILFLLLRNIANKDIVCNQLVKLMDIDNVYIKNKVLRNAYQIKNIDPETLKYIVTKATVDTNYVVRKVANEVLVKLGSLE